MVANSAPVILRGSNHAAKGGSSHFEIREFFNGGLNHFLKRIGLDVFEAMVSTFNFEAE